MSKKAQEIGIYALYLTCFSCLISSSLTAVFSIVMLVCWLASGNFKNIPVILRGNFITVLGVVFCGLLLIGIFYSPASLDVSLDFSKKYRVLLFIPIIISLCNGEDNVARNIVYALLLGYLVVLVNAYMVDFGVLAANKLSIKRGGGGFLVIFAYIVFQRALLEEKYKFLWGSFFLVICYDIFFILNTRTGWLICIGLTLLFIVQHFSWKRKLLLICVSGCLGTVIFVTSPVVQERFDTTLQNLQQYDLDAQNSETSLGVRLDWYQNSIQLIKENPIFGYGTGSFLLAQQPIIAGKNTVPTTDPHNEFFLTSVQIGLVGCAVLILLFIDPIIRSFKLISRGKRDQAFALQATVLFLFVGCLLNSWILTSRPSHIFAFLIVAFYPYRNSENVNDGRKNFIKE